MSAHTAPMASLEVAVVSRDPEVRLSAARAFDDAPASWRIRLHEEPPDKADVVVFGVDLREAANGHILFEPSKGKGVIDEVKESVASARSKLFVVTGAGRGVGVTSLALHLSALSARDHSTCFVDLDVDWGAAVRLGIDGPHKTWAEVDSDEESFRLAALPVTGGFRALLAPRRNDDEPPANGSHEVVRRATDAFERVFVDCSDNSLLDVLSARSDAGVLVVPTTIPGALRAAQLLEAHASVRWAVVLNRLGPGGETARAELHRTIGLRSATVMPCTPALRDAEDDGRLLASPWSRYVRASARLLRALESAT